MKPLTSKISLEQYSLIISIALVMVSFIAVSIVNAQSIVAEHKWENSIGNSGDYGQSVTPDPVTPGNIFVVTDSDPTIRKFDSNLNLINSANLGGRIDDVKIVGNDLYAAVRSGTQFEIKKFDTSLNVLRTYSYSSSTYTVSRIISVAVDGANNVYGIGYGNLPSGRQQVVVTKFNQTGTLLWDYGNQTSPSLNELGYEGQVLGNSLYVLVFRELSGYPFLGSRAIKFDTTTNFPSIQVNYLGSVCYSCSLRIYNGTLYNISTTGIVYTINQSTLAQTEILRARPTVWPNPTSGYECDTVKSGDGNNYITSSGMVYTASLCKGGSDPHQYRTYLSRFDLASVVAEGPFWMEPANVTTTGLDGTARAGGAAYGVNDDTAYVKSIYLIPGSTWTNDSVLWKVSFSTCTGPLSFGAWTDPILGSGGSIKSTHFDELRTRTNTLEEDAGLATTTWTDPVLTGIGPKKVHIDELRTAISGVYTTCGQGVPSWTDPTITVGATPIKAVHITEMRTAIENAP